jgi:Zn-dependent protease with chaperone function
MTAAAAIFAVLALLLAGPVPALLSRAEWTYRVPHAAMVLWQAIALAAVLSAFGSGLAIASRLLVPGPDGQPTTVPTEEIDALGLPLWLLYVAVFALTLIIGARLIFAVLLVGVRTRRRRSRNRMLVDLLGSRESRIDDARDVRVIAAAEPIAYCLPGLRQRVVLSEGTFASLDDDEIQAVVSHERSHLRSRHDLILEAFTAVHAAFPRVVRSASALGAAQLLVELLADDAAVKVTGPRPLARALVTCAGSRAPAGALAAGGVTTLIRVRRLSADPGTRVRDRWSATAAYVGSATILVVPTLAVAVPWLVELSRLVRA